MVMQLSARPASSRFRVSDAASVETFADGDALLGGSDQTSIAIPNVLAICRRRWTSIATAGFCGLLLGIAYVVLATPLFTSTASILIDTRMNQTLQKQNIIDDVPVDTSGVDSQVNVIMSDSIALDVIRSLNLTHDSEFVGPPSALGAQIMAQVTGSVSRIVAMLGLRDKAVVDPGTLLERQTLDAFGQRLTVKRKELSYLIDVAFASESPEKAARIANAVADAYMASDLAAKITSTKSANQWLQDRLLELKSQATDADHQLQQYKAANNIVETGRGLLDQQSLSDLNTQMITARAAAAEAKARLDRMKELDSDGIPDATVTDAINNPVITRLRAQYLDAAARRADLIKTVGPQHTAVLKLQDQMKQIKQSVLSEEKRIADAYASDFEIATARLASLTASMQQMVGQSEVTNQAQVRARDLESSADTYRNVYNSFLQKFQETEQAQTIPVSDSRIVTVGQVPLKKSSPKTLVGLAGGLMLGLMVGSGLAVAREIVADVFRSGTEVEKEFGVRCLGILPELKTPTRLYSVWGLFGRRGAGVDINEWVLDVPRSRFAETVRNILVALRRAPYEQGPKVIGVVSSVPKEGKTTVAANLGAMSASLGRRTLLIDGDMHQRSLSKALAPEARQGLLEAMTTPERLASFVVHRPRSNLDVLPCVTDKRLVDPAELLSSAAMATLLMVARKSYDCIIFEFAPMLPVVDVKAAGHLVDSFVFVVKWGESKRKLVSEVLLDNEVVLERLAGIVLNQADPVALRSIESYRGKTFAGYYQG